MLSSEPILGANSHNAMKQPNFTIGVALVVATATFAAHSQPRKPAQPVVSAPAEQQPAAANTPHPLCAVTDSLIEAGLKEVAHHNISGLLDNSAPRESMRQQKVSAAWSSITAQLLHAQMLKCPAFSRPIAPDAYKRAAVSCYTAERKPDFKEKCDRATWLRDADMPPDQ